MAARSAANLGSPQHGVAGARSLAEALASGPLPLPVALAYGREIASVAAVFHGGGQASGALTPARVTIGAQGPILQRPNGMSHLATLSSDMRDFGLLLHQMLTGLNPADYSSPATTDDNLEPSPEMVKSAALRLVERCCCTPGETDMRHVSTELRLLQIMLNGFEPGDTAVPAKEYRPVEPPAKPAAFARPPAPAQPAAPTRPEAPARPAAPAVSGKVAKPVVSANRGSGCPACGSPEYFPSQHLTPLEKMLAVVDLTTYRCYGCCQRFISIFGLHVPRPES